MAGLPSNFLGDLIAATQGGTVEPMQNSFGRLISGLGRDPTQIPDSGAIMTPGMSQADMGAAPRMAAPSGQPRRSVLDMIGGIADTIASVGGASPLYQQNLDARRARQIAEEDRSFQLDQRPLERQLMEQKLKAGSQGIEAGGLELQNARNEQLEGVGAGLRQVFASTGTEGLQKAWPLVAQQFGIDPERAQQIGAAFAADPEGTLAAIFPEPMNAKASKSKEVQIYELLASEGTPEEAAAYRKSLTDPDALTPKERATLDLAERRFAFDQYKYANPQPSAGERKLSAQDAAKEAQREQATTGALTFLDDLENVVTTLNNSGGMTNKNQSIGGALGTFAKENVPLVERLANPEGYAAREQLDGLLTQGVSALLPMLTGMAIGSKNMDAAKEMENLKRAVLSAKSYEAAMEAIQHYRRNLQTRAAEPAPRAAPAPRPRASGAPAPRQLAKPPAVGTVRQGYRFKGGNPADKSNWVKVQ